ncbi:hypothetical protein [Deefgea sp. CFH1-16]|uniref:hypothetical protein n=1 Tax=Deefgea sp. CFH1-16 TaxID=2675457 RepID=UPI0015F42747|nr:hypothetical protein [Deefgea sp. CFH1-16]MBM5574426.1 hypothetical protein [Deefgea sp. CFH1-16]
MAEEKQTYSKLISKYGFSDLDENKIFGTRLHSILRKLESENLSFNADDANYLIINEFFALQKFASREINFEDFTTQSLLEQDKRTIDTITERERIRIERENVYIELKLQQEQRAVLMRIEHDRILAEKIRHDNDPINIAKAKQEKLKNKYGISGFIEKDYFKKLIDILNKVDADTRLTDEDIVWLETTAKQYFTFELRKAYHRIEAKFHHDEFSTTKDPWSAVNASAHYRKSDQSRAANTLLSTIDIDTKKDTKLKSAFCTTHGGVKRDLRLQTEALTLGDKAHQLTPHNFRPCTLLGAVNMEIGNYDLGQSWYAKAVERGYTEKSVDEELKQIFKRADKIQKEALRTHLLKTDPVRYSWANTKNKA